MATEPNIRNLFPADDTPTKALDAGAIIRRSRARRLPKRLAIGGITTLAVAGIVVASVQVFGTTVNISASSQQSEATAEEAPAEQSAPDSPMSASGTAGTDLSSKRAPADRINQCGGTLAEFAPDESALTVTVDFPDSATLDGTTIRGTVTLTNTSDATVSGHLERDPTMVFSRDGVVLWHTNGGVISAMYTFPRPIEPGQSVDFTTSFWPVICSAEDEEHPASRTDPSKGFGDELPEVAPGEYQLSALFDFAGGGVDDVIVGPTATITLK